MHRRAFSASLGLIGLVAACGGDVSVDDHDDGAAFDSSDEVLEAGLPAEHQALLRAAECEGTCTVLHAVPLRLPALGRAGITRGKIRMKDGSLRDVAVDRAGHRVDAQALLADDRQEHEKRFGRLTPELHEWLSKAKPSDQRWVWTWSYAAPQGPRVPKAPVGLKPLALPVVDALRQDLLAKRRDVEFGDASGPMLRFRASADEVRALAEDPRIGLLGTDGYPGKPQSAPWGGTSQWGGTIRLAAAHQGVASPGLGAKVCVKDGARPTNESQLPIVAWANAGGTTLSAHTLAASAAIANNAVTAAPWQSVAPKASLYVANFLDYSAAGGVDGWCASNGVPTISYSYAIQGGYGVNATDVAHDYLAKTYPYPLVVASAGSANAGAFGGDIVVNRGFNGLVVGAIVDGNTSDPGDDVWNSQSAHVNPPTSHGDYELPHLVAPGDIEALGTSLAGTSGATAAVAGVGALVSQADTGLDSWPEAKRAVILATATKRANGGAFTSLTLTPGDKVIGVGVLDAQQAVDLASPANAVSPSAVRSKGRLGRTVQLVGGSDWDASGYLVTKWKARADSNGRIRVVIAWDATTNCTGPATGCSTSTPDADFDLHIFPKAAGGDWAATGTMACSSSTYDSTYEVCDFSATAGQEFLIAIKKYGVSIASTYLGVAWYQYAQTSGSPCSSGTECVSGSCSGGTCACAADGDCPDRFCGGGTCTNRLGNGPSCARPAQCASGYCVDGVCCDTACAGSCQACSAAKKGGGVDGACAFVANGLNPDGECAGPSCVAGTYNPPKACNGGGSCIATAASSPCAPFNCNAAATACSTTCVADADCSSGNWCSGGVCVAKRSLAATCTGANQCASGFCEASGSGSVCCSGSVNDGNACTVDSCSSITGLPVHNREAASASCAALWGASPTLTATQVSATSVQLDWSAATHASSTVTYKVYRSDSPVFVGTTTARTWNGSVTAGVTYTFRVEAVATSGGTTVESTDGPTVAFVGVAPPAVVVPPLSTDTSVATDFKDSVDYLYTGSGAPQTGLTTGALVAERLAVVRGQIMTASLAPVPGVRVTVLGHPEFGQTLTKSDGSYDLAVNGGGHLVLQFTRTGYVTVQRGVVPRPGDHTSLAPVVLTPLSPVVLTLATGSGGWQTLRSPVATDADGTRRSTILVPPGTGANLVTDTPSGPSETPVSGILHVRATELTVGLLGSLSMPGDLPGASAYTYAIALDADEALAAGARSIKFTTPVSMYVKDFIGFPTGESVPLGYYDRLHGYWVPEKSGRVVTITAVVDGKAQLDVDALTAASLGITDGELRQLVADTDGDGLPDHTVGDKLWRVQLSHFSDWDTNWGNGFPITAVIPKGEMTPNEAEDPCLKDGSIVECENQVLGERLPLVGTGATLEYWSSRALARVANRSVRVRVSGPETLPSSVQLMVVNYEIAGQTWHQQFSPGSDKWTAFTWDGLDHAGRRVVGKRPLTTRIGYVYKTSYSRTPEFGAPPAGAITISGVRDSKGGGPLVIESGLKSGRYKEQGGYITIWQNERLVQWLGAMPATGAQLGQFDLGIHHTYEPAAQKLVKGSGERIDVGRVGALSVRTVTGGFLLGGGGDGVRNLTAAPDGTIYYVYGPASGPQAIGRYRAGIDTRSYWSPTTGSSIRGLTVAPDGFLYVTVQNPTFAGVVRVDTAGGTPTSVVITGGAPGDSLSPIKASEGRVDQLGGIAVTPDGNLFFLSQDGQKIRRIAPPSDVTKTHADGLMSTLPVTAGTYFGLAADGAGNLFTTRPLPTGGSGRHIIRIDPTYAETTMTTVLAAGWLYDVRGLTVTPSGVPVASTGVYPQIVALRSDGSIEVVAGTGSGAGMVEGPAILATLSSQAGGVAALPNGDIAIAGNDRVSVLTSSVRIGSAPTTDYVVSDRGSTEVYVFDVLGRHKATIDGLLNKTIWQFGYVGSTLKSFTDAAGRTTTIYRAGESTPEGGTVVAGRALVRGPYGQTTELVFNASGDLVSVADPSAYAWTFDWVVPSPGEPPTGLLKTLTDPDGLHQFEWTTDGRLKKDTAPSGRFLQLTQPASSDASWQVVVTDPTSVPVTHETKTGTLGYRRVTAKDGTVTQELTSMVGAAIQKTLTKSGAPTVVISQEPDPVFGMGVPKQTTVTTATLAAVPPATPVSLVRTVSHTVSTDPAGARFDNLLSRIDTIAIRGPAASLATTPDVVTTTLTTRNADATTTISRQMSSGAKVVATLDAQGLLKTMAFGSYTASDSDPVPPIHPVNYTWTGGRLTGVSQGTRSSSVYYPSSTTAFPTSSTDVLGNATTYDLWDASGRLQKVTMPGFPQMEMTYDKGRLQSLKPPGRPAHQFDYTTDGALDHYTLPKPDPADTTTPRVYDNDYDSMGRLKLATRPGGTTIKIDRDAKDRIEKITDSTAGGIVRTFSYDDAGGTGRLTGIAYGGAPGVTPPPGASLSIDYDGPLPKSHTWSGGISGSLEWGYDNHLRMASEKVTLGGVSSTVQYRYDGDGRLWKVGAAADSVPTLTFNYHGPTGLLLGTSVYGGAGYVNSEYTYNKYAELKSQTYKFVSTGAPTVLYDAQFEGTGFTRDAAGRIKKKVETFGGVTKTYEYEYDPATGALRKVYVNGALSEEYTYGANGVRLTAMRGGVTTTATYDDQDRIKTFGSTTYTFNAAGDLASKTDATGTTAYGFDGHHHLTRIEFPDGQIIEYVIDAAGRRVGKKTGSAASGTTLRRSWVYSGPRLVAELDAAGGLVAQFVYGGSGQTPSYMVRSGVIYRILTDERGSVRAVVRTSDGAILQRHDYDSFGGSTATEVSLGWASVPFGFGGGLVDSALAGEPVNMLIRFGARDYDAGTGVWLSRDPIRFDGGTNHYQYAANDPINRVDPSGLLPDDSGGWDRWANYAEEHPDEAMAIGLFGMMVAAPVVGEALAVVATEMICGAGAIGAGEGLVSGGFGIGAGKIAHHMVFGPPPGYSQGKYAGTLLHVFGPKPLVRHNLVGFLSSFGGDQQAALAAIQAAVDRAAPAFSGPGQISVVVNGYQLTVRLFVDAAGNNVINTAFM